MKKNKNNIYPYVSYICIGDDPPVKWDSLSLEDRIKFSKKMMDKVSENLSRYVNSHPEESESIK